MKQNNTGAILNLFDTTASVKTTTQPVVAATINRGKVLFDYKATAPNQISLKVYLF